MASGLAADRLDSDAARLSRLRDKLIQGALAAIPGYALNGHPTQRLPTNASLNFINLGGETLCTGLLRPPLYDSGPLV